MGLLEQVVAALANPDATTAQLDVLNQQTGRDQCHRRQRILYQLQQYVAQNSIAMAAPSTTHRFKKDFIGKQANIEVNGQTKAVTAKNLANEDVPLLIQYDYGHFLEEIPKPEKPAKAEEKEAKKDEKK